jgi:hypothetical protein
MPHMNSFGDAPKLDDFNFPYWKSSMRSHLKSVCVELWDIVENSYTLSGEKYLTPVEKVECQLNSTALDKIRQSLKRGVYDQVASIESAKELWEKLSIMFEGTSAMQKSKYEDAKQEMNMFCLLDGESFQSVFSRLTSLKEKIISLGGNDVDDGFVMSDKFIRSKFIEVIAPQYKELAFNVTYLDHLKSLPADELVGYFVAHDNMIAKTTKNQDINRAL